MITKLEKAIDKGTCWGESVELITSTIVEIKALQAQLAAYRWRPVGEGLPEYKKKVWLCNINVPDGFYKAGHLIHSQSLPSGKESDEWFIGYGDIRFLTSFTHWMPITTLPKGE